MALDVEAAAAENWAEIHPDIPPDQEEEAENLGLDLNAPILCSRSETMTRKGTEDDHGRIGQGASDEIEAAYYANAIERS